ncbi:MAG: hypothetical protein ACLU4N_10700 [Butyricimonas faecihominis]
MIAISQSEKALDTKILSMEVADTPKKVSKYGENAQEAFAGTDKKRPNEKN